MNMVPGGKLGGRPKGHYHMGEKNPFYGKKHSEETKRKMSLTKWRQRCVGCYDTNGILIKEYHSPQEITDDGYCMNCVYNCLSGRIKTHKHKIFKEISNH